MLLKWIVCEVPGDRRVAFGLAQEQWRAIAVVDGFAGQLGGWSTSDVDRACIMAFWRDQAALDSFMQREHDPIVRRSEQAETYTSIGVVVLPIAEVTRDVIAGTTRLRVADRFIDLLRNDELLLRITIPSASLDADTVLIEPAWTIEPVH